jgi:hypothetical protein
MTQINPILTREQWLRVAKLELDARIFKFIDHQALNIQDVHVSFGIPKGQRKAIGQCFDQRASEDKKSHVFISPTLTDESRILDVLLHELIHSYVGLHHGHRGAFKIVAVKAGLEGKMTATTSGPELQKVLEAIKQKLGPLAHAGLNLANAKKQKTRLVKLTCSCCGMILRSAKTQLEEIGLPICPYGNTFEVSTK